MNTSAPPKLLPHLWKSTLVSGILAVILGVLILAWPGESIVVAAILFGIYLLLTGVSQVIFAFSLGVSAGGRVLLFIGGAAALVLGLLSIRQLWTGDVALVVLLLAIWVGIGFVFRGVATAVSAISDPALPGRGWAIFFGVVSLLAGIVMLVSPFGSLGVLMLVVGIWLIVLGVSEVLAAFSVRNAMKKWDEFRTDASSTSPAEEQPVS